MRSGNRNHARSGVILLLLLGMLAMFTLLGLTFMMIASQGDRSARVLQRAVEQTDPPPRAVDDALMQVVRGSTNETSVLWPHSLLEDMYGDQSEEGQVAILDFATAGGTANGNAVATKPTLLVGGQFFEFSVFTFHPERYVGCLLTMLSGASTGVSTQIVGYTQARDAGGALMYWPDVPQIPVDFRNQPIWRLRAIRNGTLPLGPDMRPGVANANDDAVAGIDDLEEVSWPLGAVPNDDLRPGDRFVINGLQFAGTGIGFNGVDSLDAESFTQKTPSDTSDESTFFVNTNLDRIALLPNPTTRNFRTWIRSGANRDTTVAASTDDDNPALSQNEDYDAVDPQNMLLAMVSQNGRVQIPSLHRPALAKYWFRLMAEPAGPINWSLVPAFETDEAARWRAILQPGNFLNLTIPAHLQLAQQIARLKRGFLLRPLAEDHPNFDGSNPGSIPDITDPTDWPLTRLQTESFELAGPWDVDNDGDGVPDSNWADLGMPVRSTLEGKLYKPLCAVLCLDLDGRVNINAHGSLAEFQGNDNSTGPYAGVASGTAPLPRGEGYGPADVQLSAFVPAPDAQRLMQGDATLGLEGRYGEGGTTSPRLPNAGRTDNPEAIARLKDYEFPSSYNDYALNPGTAVRRAFGTPSDLWGRMTLGLDHRGQPFYFTPAWNWDFETYNHPYEIELCSQFTRPGVNWGTAVDNPFTLPELERILRRYDRDASALPNRLPRLSSNLQSSRGAITTDSWHVPSISPTAPRELVTQAQTYINTDLPLAAGDAAGLRWLKSLIPPRSLGDLVRLKRYVRFHATGGTWAAAVPSQIDTYVGNFLDPRYLPVEVLAGMQMDLNRPFGNSRDDDANGVVDDSAEMAGAAETGLGPNWSAEGFNVYGYDRPFYPHGGVDVSGTGNPNLNRLLARQLFARQLFILAMLLYDPEYAPTTGGTVDAGLNAQDRQELMVRRIAQWAINVVDFRDADSIMTPFEYVTDPFDNRGWNVDGVIANNEADKTEFPDVGGNEDPRYNPNRRVVWGCEYPDLLITETQAFHDRRVADTEQAGSNDKKQYVWDSANSAWTKVGADPDGGLDQTRIPQGTALFELYCTGNPNNPNPPRELYTYDSSNKVWNLDLARMAPAGAGVPAYPVWRLAVSGPAAGGGGSPDNIMKTRLSAEPDSSSIEPARFPYIDPQTGTLIVDPKARDRLLGPENGSNMRNAQVDRVVWFTDTPPTANHLDADHIYYNRTADAGLTFNRYLRQGGYAIVGPRPRTFVGSTNVSLGQPSRQEINLQNVGYVRTDGTATYPTFTGSDPEIQPPVVVIAASPSADPTTNAAWPTGWAANSQAAPFGIGVSVSEPLFSAASYYPEPTHKNSATNVVDAYADLQAPNNGFLPSTVDTELQAEGVLATQTYLDYKTVFLQRLADPTLPYNSVTNPYITVDWSSIDLTVFNGEDQANYDPPLAEGQQWDPADPTQENRADQYKNVYMSRERGDANFNFNLWTRSVTLPHVSAAPAAGGQLNFPIDILRKDVDLTNPSNDWEAGTLGYLNSPFHTRFDPANPLPPSPQQSDLRDRQWLTQKSLTSKYPSSAIAYVGDPMTPFPWLAWNNRPFANPLEVMRVPSSSPARLLWELRTRSNADPYQDTMHANGFDFYTTSDSGFYPYGDLLNFFSSDPNPGGGGAVRSPQLYRLLDYLRVPSRFVGTGMAYHPAPPFVGPEAAPYGFTQQFKPPFDREPGRVNINTVSSRRVWDAVRGRNRTAANWNWDKLVESRMGYPPPGANHDPWEIDPNGAVPTCVGNPFRSASRGLLAPLTNMQQQRDVNTTLLRADTDNPETSHTPMFQAAYAEACRNPVGNPYFNYQDLERISNIVTTRSNVYAIWITVGYFEVQRVQGAYDPYVYPDGYTLGKELGIDTGNVKRHRAFYIFDRSIPVGFERGKDLNVEKGILLKRFIE